jgi:hypothetical protein
VRKIVSQNLPQRSFLVFEGRIDFAPRLGGSEKIFCRAAYMNGIEVRAESPGKFRRVGK